MGDHSIETEGMWEMRMVHLKLGEWTPPTQSGSFASVKFQLNEKLAKTFSRWPRVYLKETEQNNEK